MFNANSLKKKKKKIVAIENNEYQFLADIFHFNKFIFLSDRKMMEYINFVLN